MILLITPVFSIPDWAKEGNYVKYKFVYSEEDKFVSPSKNITCEGILTAFIIEVYETYFSVKYSLGITSECKNVFGLNYESYNYDNDPFITNKFLYVNPSKIKEKNIITITLSYATYILEYDKSTGWLVKFLGTVRSHKNLQTVSLELIESNFISQGNWTILRIIIAAVIMIAIAIIILIIKIRRAQIIQKPSPPY
jgi:hypothetical protein